MAEPEAFAEQVLIRLIDLLAAPLAHPEMLWIAFPLIGSLLFMEFYFSRHKEKLSWESAFSNGVALVFVAFDTARYMFTSSQEQSLAIFLSAEYLPKTFIIALLFLYAFFLLSINFLRLLPDFICLKLSSHTATCLGAYAAISIIYTGIPLDMETVAAAIAFLTLSLIGLLTFNSTTSKILNFKPSAEQKKEMKRSKEMKMSEIM